MMSSMIISFHFAVYEESAIECYKEPKWLVFTKGVIEIISYQTGFVNSRAFFAFLNSVGILNFIAFGIKKY